ncbi:MAG: hypothetical protein V4676_02595 [Bacteroidota bacterium]
MNEDATELLQKINPQLTASQKEILLKQLADYVNHLLLHNFSQLVQLLYRVDVSEKKLKRLLKDHPSTDAGVLIANILWTRHAEKIKSASANKTTGYNIREDDKW